MIRYSHVSLLIPCAIENGATITSLLGVQPTRIRESKSQGQREDGSWQESTHYTWMLDSSKSHLDGDPTARLYALADIIEPFAARLPSLRPQFTPWIDIVYHVTPQHPHGVTGEFDWLRMPAELMRRYSAWDLGISYESFWFNHPDWMRPQRQGFFSRFFAFLPKPKPNKPHAANSRRDSQCQFERFGMAAVADGERSAIVAHCDV
jgi:hypothetical protein